MKKVIITVVILSMLLLGAVGYIGYGFYSDMKLQGEIEIYQAGYEQAIFQMFSQMFQDEGSCQPVPIRYGNQTLNIIAVECLQQPPTE